MTKLQRWKTDEWLPKTGGEGKGGGCSSKRGAQDILLVELICILTVMVVIRIYLWENCREHTQISAHETGKVLIKWLHVIHVNQYPVVILYYRMQEVTTGRSQIKYVWDLSVLFLQLHVDLQSSLNKKVKRKKTLSIISSSSPMPIVKDSLAWHVELSHIPLVP